jgi:hypothetical protein
MSRPDDGLIHAWLDGELDAVEAARVAKLVETDAEWGAAAAEARGLIAASSRIVKALDVVPAGVIPSGSKAGGASPRRTVVRPWLRIAATIALVAGVGYVATPSRVSDVFEQDGPSEGEVVSGDESGETTVVQTTAPTAPSPVSPAVARDERSATEARGGLESRGALDGRVGGAGAESQRRELAKTSAAMSDSIAAANAATRERIATATEEQLRDARVTLRQDSAAPTAASGRSAVTAAAPTIESRAVAPPPAAAPTASGSGQRVGSVSGDRASGGAGAATEQAKVTMRAAEPTAQLRPRQVIDRERAPSAPSEPSALAATDAMLERVLPGCWRTQTRAPADSILVDPRILSVAADSIVIVLNRAALDIRALDREVLPRAIVVRVGTSILRGTARNTDGAVVPFSATRTTCP